MFAFIVLVTLGLTGGHMATTNHDTGKVSEVKLGVTIILDVQYMPLSRKSAHLTRYLTTFLKAVELRFSDMIDPKISLVLTDILEMTPAQEADIYGMYNIIKNTIYGIWTRDYLRETKNPFPENEGIKLIMTGFDLWSADERVGGNITNSADKNGACTKSNVALCEDDGLTFSGVGSAAKAIAQLLGAEYDFNNSNQTCRQYHGYLLDNYTGISDHYNLSVCGKEYIKKRIEDSSAQRKACLSGGSNNNKAKMQVPESQELPFDFFERTNPCNLKHGAPSCKPWRNETGCKVHCCLKHGVNETVNKHDGAPCGKKQNML
uniref:Putative secreted metalloprotease n=1 Tax=Ixodes ricinus TaxID=34613 RepID=A0A6B0V7Y6_IXORI